MSEQDNLQEVEGTIENTIENTTESIDTPVKNVDAALQEIEDSNAEDAEDHENEKRHEVLEKDYHAMDMDTLVSELTDLLKDHPVQTINKQVNLIKDEFDAKFSEFLETKKNEFLAEGGNEIDFRYHSVTQNNFKNSYAEFRSKRNVYYKNLENNLKDNFTSRTVIIDKIKALIDESESINDAYSNFKDLQTEWRNAGAIPRDKYNTIWNNYHHHVERFYDYLHLDRDFRNLDFKHNLEEKQKIVLKAQELTTETNINKAFRELQNLHKLWKEEIGPVSKEYRNDIWNKFSEATKIIHKKRQAFFDEAEKVYEQNFINKNLIIDKIEEISADTEASHKEWQSKIKDIEELRQLFFNAGKVPYKYTEQTWKKFKNAVRNFNHTKNKYYKSLKKDQQENLNKKQVLVQIAEDNKNSDDFNATTPIMKKIQGDWQKIGHVPRKDSDKIWKKFKNACNHYFERINAQKNKANEKELEALTLKEAYLQKVIALKLEGEHHEKLSVIKEHIEHWKTLGYVPKNKKSINDQFNKALDNLFNQLDIDKGEANAIKYANKLSVLENDQRALDNELVFVKRKADEIKGELLQLENNLSFFANAKKDNPLVKEVFNKIDLKKEDLKSWKDKVQQIKAIYKKQKEAKQKEEQKEEGKSNEA